MSENRDYSPQPRRPTYPDWSDDESYPASSHGREKFRRERSIDRERSSGRGGANERGGSSRDYDSRKRGRSPTPQEERRYKRRRSPTPPSRAGRNSGGGRDGTNTTDGDHYVPNYDRDGYNPGPKFGNLPESPAFFYPMMGDGFMPPEFMGVPLLGGWPPLPRPPLADPNQLDYLVTFKHFCEHLRGTQPSQVFDDDELQKRYAIYKENFAARQLTAFFERHRKAEWFVEKYHPAKSASRVEEARALRRKLYDKFIGELTQGKYDDVDFDEPEQAALTRKEKKEGEEGEAEGEEQVGTDGAGDVKMMEEAKLDGSEQQQPSESEQLSHKLIIKTVPPSISRKKIVTMCQDVEGFEYLALSEPSPTKKFHRIGWIVFKEGTNMGEAFDKLNNKKIDDFVFHLAMHKHQPPSRTRVAPDIASTFERLTHDLERARRLVQAVDAELGDGVEGYNLASSRAQKTIEHHREEVERKRAEEDRIQAQVLADQNNDVEMEREEGEGDAEDTETESRTAREKRREHEDLVWETKKLLDMFIQYLRRVHLYCYYCGSESDSIEELQRKCVDHHWRKRVPAGAADKATAGKSEKSEKSVAQWAKNLDQKVELKLKKPIDKEIEKMGGKDINSEIENFMRDNVFKEHDAKYKCKINECKKAFKGYEFVEKHIRHKHPETIEKLEEEHTFFNNYVCDPNHLLPTTPPNPSSANSHNAVLAQQAMVNPLPILPGSIIGAPPGATVGPYVLPPIPIGANGAPLRIPHGFPPVQGAAPGTPWDQIPRIGFHEGAGWGPMMGNRKLDNRQPKNGSAGNGSAGGTRNSVAATGAAGVRPAGGRIENELPLARDLPRDPRQMTSYVDLDAPAEGDIDLNYG